MTERRGVTLIELLIGIAVLAGQFMFVLPTVRAAHDADRQSQRSDRVNQIALNQLALQHTSHNHNSVAPSITTALGLGNDTSFRVVSGPFCGFCKTGSFAPPLIDRLRFLAPFPG